jgi:hypothetical protein
VFVLWLVLFTVQILLIRAKKLSVHKQLGLWLAGLAGLMVILGPATALTVQHHSMADPNGDPGFLSVSVRRTTSLNVIACDVARHMSDACGCRA